MSVTQPNTTNFNTPNIEAPELITVKQAAALFNTTSYTIIAMLRNGRLDGFQLGTGRGEWRIHAESVRKLLQPSSRQDAQ